MSRVTTSGGDETAGDDGSEQAAPAAASKQAEITDVRDSWEGDVKGGDQRCRKRTGTRKNHLTRLAFSSNTFIRSQASGEVTAGIGKKELSDQHRFCYATM